LALGKLWMLPVDAVVETWISSDDVTISTSGTSNGIIWSA
jgi:hypothetical protein